MGRYQAKLEQKGALLGRIVDIGAELYAIACACTYASTLAEEDPAHATRSLSWPTCSAARRAAAPTQRFHELWANDDASSTRRRSRCSRAATSSSSTTWSTRPAMVR